MGHTSVTRQKLGKNMYRKTYTSKTGKTSSVTINTQDVGNGTTITHYDRSNDIAKPKAIPRSAFNSGSSNHSSSNYSSGDDASGKFALLIVGLVVVAIGALFAGLFAVGKKLFTKASESYKEKQAEKLAVPALENNVHK